jgi:hypothetical protein
MPPRPIHCRLQICSFLLAAQQNFSMSCISRNSLAYPIFLFSSDQLIRYPQLCNTPLPSLLLFQSLQTYVTSPLMRYFLPPKCGEEAILMHVVHSQAQPPDPYPHASQRQNSGREIFPRATDNFPVQKIKLARKRGISLQPP